MKKKLLLWTVFFIARLSAISLEECLQFMKENNPIFQTDQVWTQLQKNTNDVYNAKFLPQLSTEASSKWQSETMSFPMDSPLLQMPTQNEFSTAFSIQISQLVYDGGMIDFQKQIQKSRIALEQKSEAITRMSMEAELISNYYQIILANEQLSILKRKEKDLDSTLIAMNKSVKIGLTSKKNVWELEAILLELKEKIESVNTLKRKSIKNLESLIYKKISSKTFFAFPALLTEKARPEWQIFALKKTLNKQKSNAIKTLMKPKIRIGVKAAYGNPGLNMFHDGWQEYAVINLQLQWKIWDWKQHKKQVKENDLRNKLTHFQLQSFTSELEKESAVAREEIQFLKNQKVRLYKEKLLKEKIHQSIKKAFLEGTATATTYRNALTSYYEILSQIEINKIKLSLEQQKLNRFYGIQK